MQNIATLWTTLDPRRRIIIILAGIAMFAAVLGLSRMATAPSLNLLYAGLESGPAGEVVRALEQRGVTYEVRGGAIFVDSAQRDTLRMTLASEGLPSNSSQGYELLDTLSGFGTTSQMFDAAYWRAKEGELARTIVSNPAIVAARVHIANTGSNPFQRDVRSTASVMITSAGGDLPAKQAQALKFLVASAVAGLTADDVSIIDSSGGLIGGAEEAPSNAGEDRSDALRQRVQRLLEARVGPGNAVVEVSVDTVKTTEMIREKTIDPDSRVAISIDTEERTNSASDEGGGDVTVASNLPDGDGAGGDGSSSQTNETRERINYEVSQTEREITQAPGAIKRLSVAVLVNGTVAAGADGAENFQPRSDAEMEALRDLVASAVGYDETRGDVITLKSLQFEPLTVSGTAAAPSFWSTLGLDVLSLIQAAVLAIVALILGLFVIRPILSPPRTASTPALAAPGTANQAAPDAKEQAPQASLTGEIDTSDMDEASLPVVSGRSAITASQAAGEDPVARLRGMISGRQEETVEILRTWLEGEEESA
ncbi:flagellar M-ring protein FliF [Roseovarius nanhaiticus]|uniref:Flagellar M-ring protein n=1 Tax=Roseovarius nanhaiticus TaxID=573024 RepID=A0A1N7HL12_9RHOB|nr:flagellar basal-body MS-ring/collar protein FliF [Roseovarius nanhaiticus]SEL27148.1 flagellar M-ring protein FliF [Roseovarius nanhaiticus]SIS25564.1 flagellar M-ring protein FliF [Roseovarius nanhaiticus]